MELPAGTVGELLGEPIGFKRILTSSDDLNDIDDGEYSYLNGNNPANNYGTNTMIVQKTTRGRNDKLQLAFCSNEKSIGARMSYAGVWQQWKDIVTGL